MRLSIPLQWRETLSANWSVPPIFPGGPLLMFPGQPPLDISNLTSKQAYKVLLAGKKVESTAFLRCYRTDSQLSVADRDEWNRTCKRIYATTRETKFQSFQYKIIHAITPCRKFLKQLRIVDDDRCPHCGITDDIVHFFCQCEKVQAFWTKVHQWLSSQADIHLQHVTPKEIILGVDDSSPNGSMINFILLHFRFFIHRQRLFHDNKFELLHWIAELRSRLRCLERVLRIEGKSQQFRKWRPLIQVLG